MSISARSQTRRVKYSVTASGSLLALDVELAAQTRERGCPHCGGALHSARYLRKPRGGPWDVGEELAVRHSFCCARDGCRRRDGAGLHLCEIRAGGLASKRALSEERLVKGDAARDRSAQAVVLPRCGSGAMCAGVPRDTAAPQVMAAALFAELQGAGVTERTTVQSADWRTLQWFARQAPDIARACLTSEDPAGDTIERDRPGASPWSPGSTWATSALTQA